MPPTRRTFGPEYGTAAMSQGSSWSGGLPPPPDGKPPVRLPVTPPPAGGGPAAPAGAPSAPAAPTDNPLDLSNDTHAKIIKLLQIAGKL